MSSTMTSPTGSGGASAFDAARRAASAADGQPAERMAAPSCLRRASTAMDGSLVAPFWLKGKDLLVEFPGEAAKSASAESIATAINSPGIVAMPMDRRTQRAMVARCQRAGDTHRANARLVDFATRMPMSSKLIILTDALARKFWLQPGLSESSITDWCTAFGMTRKVESLQWLAGRVFDDANLSGKQDFYRRQMFEAEDKAVAAVVDRGASAAMAAFDASSSVHALWGAYERIDSVLRYRFMASTGEVARATPIRRDADQIVVALSSPFKVREGEVLVVSEADPDHINRPATLANLGFEDAYGLTATIVKPARDVRSGAMSMLDGALAARDSVLITSSPYIGRANFTPSVFRWATQAGADKADPIGRDVPLDVALAGAPIHR